MLEKKYETAYELLFESMLGGYYNLYSKFSRTIELYFPDPYNWQENVSPEPFKNKRGMKIIFKPLIPTAEQIAESEFYNLYEKILFMTQNGDAFLLPNKKDCDMFKFAINRKSFVTVTYEGNSLIIFDTDYDKETASEDVFWQSYEKEITNKKRMFFESYLKTFSEYFKFNYDLDVEKNIATFKEDFPLRDTWYGFISSGKIQLKYPNKSIIPSFSWDTKEIFGILSYAILYWVEAEDIEIQIKVQKIEDGFEIKF